MANENVEVVRAVFDAVTRGDRDGVLALYDTEVEVVATPGTFADRLGGRGVHRGHEAVRSLHRELRDVFESIETTCDELIDAGEQVVSVSRYRARGRRSGVEIDGAPQFGVWDVRDRRIVRVVWFGGREDAYAAAGLRE